MENRGGGDDVSANLDFEDLVDELNQFEKDAAELKKKIAVLMEEARQVTGSDQADRAE